MDAKKSSGKLIVIENSGSLAHLVTAELANELEAAVGAKGEGCSIAIESRSPSGVSVEMFSVGQGEALASLEGDARYREALAGGGGVTCLAKVFGQALLAHWSLHGEPPGEIVFWSDFLDDLPSYEAMFGGSQDKGANEPMHANAKAALAGCSVVCAVAACCEMGPGIAWAKALEEISGARCRAIPAEGISALAFAEDLAASVKQPKCSSPALRM